MRAAYQSGLVVRDPTIGLKPPRHRTGDPDGRVSPDDVPTRDEVLAILAAAPSPYRASIARRSLGIAGLRVGEMLGVTADRLDLGSPATLLIDRQLQYVESRMQFSGPKREKDPDDRTAVRNAAGDPAASPRAPGSRTSLPRTPRRSDAPARSVLQLGVASGSRAAGLDESRFKFHSLRHFCASSMLADGTPITAVAGHLGDTVETISKVYLHRLRDDRSVPRIVLDRLRAARRRRRRTRILKAMDAEWTPSVDSSGPPGRGREARGR